MKLGVSSKKPVIKQLCTIPSETRALLIKRLNPTSRFNYNPSEMLALTKAAGYRVVETIIQKTWPRSPYVIGKGKVQELKELIDEKNIDVVIFDDHLNPSSFFHLEQMLSRPVVDRYHLILKIFECHSHDRVSRLQIELARLRYEMPRYAEFVKRKLSGTEHPGFLGSGTPKVADYERMIKRRIVKVKEKLEKIRQERQTRRKRRERQGFKIISLVGYYNAGKSSLHRTLTGSNARVSAEPFSTLATKIRRVDEQILVNDTVGFIENLPLEFMEAFRSTLEEVSSSDLILLILDVSDGLEQIVSKLNTCRSILAELSAPNAIIHVLCKVDLIKDDIEKEYTLEELFKEEKHIFVSNVTLEGTAILKDMIKKSLLKNNGNYDEHEPTSLQKIL
ncbi:MAG: GTPase HflX [Candidatus Heimdallarchaeota archaeon]